MDPSQNNSFDSGAQGGAPIISSGDQGSSFGAMPVSSGVSNGTGDIILNGGGEKKSKRGVIVGAVIIVVLAVVALFAALVLPKILEGNNSDLANFNRYVNYVLYGEETEQYKAGELTSGQTYFNKQMASSESAKGFFEKANGLWAKTAQTIKNDNAGVVGEYKQQRELYELLATVYTKEILRRDQITNYYAENGSEATKEYVANYYVISAETNNQFLKDFKDTVVARGDAVVDRLALFDGVGCFGEFEDYGCFLGAASDEQKTSEKNLLTEYSEYNSEYNNYFGAYETYLMALQQVYAGLNGQGGAE